MLGDMYITEIRVYYSVGIIYQRMITDIGATKSTSLLLRNITIYGAGSEYL